MAKKQTKRTPKRASSEVAPSTSDALRDAETKTAEKRAELAAERYVRWLRLYAKLDEIQPDALEYFRYGRRFSDAEIDAEIARHPYRYRHGREDAEWGLQHLDRWYLTLDLSTLASRLPAIGSEIVDESGRKTIDDLLRACQDKSFEPGLRFSELVAHAMRVVQAVMEIDGKRSQGSETVGSEDDRAVLKRLLDKPKTAKEIATELAGGKSHLVDDARVERTIRRLKREHGFELPNIRGSGYFLSPADRARVERMT